MRSGKPLTLAHRTILVVDDEFVGAMELTALLEQRGATIVGPLASVAQVLELIAQGLAHIDAAVLDVKLGSQEAYPSADALLARNVPVVFVTGYDTADMPAPYRSRPVLR